MAQDQSQSASLQVAVSTKYQVLNEQRVVIFTGRDQFALRDTVLAVPFGLLKYLAGSLVSAEGQAELRRMGARLLADDQGGKAT